MELPDFYQLLGVSRDASDEELKKAYRKLARELHPDANPGDAEAENKFKQVTFAYETLRDPDKRSRYDAYGADGIAGTGSGGGMSDPFAGFGGIGDIFEAFFGAAAAGSSRRASNRHGPDLETMVTIELKDVVAGTNAEVTVKSPVVCSTCDGSGANAGSSPVNCKSCHGSGEVRRVRQSILGQMVTSSICTSCRGAGQIINDPCIGCRGEGRRTEDRTHQMEIPAGIDNGATLRLSGKGGAGPRRSPAGDLYVHIRIKDDKRFVRDGNTLHTELHVPVTQAALGAKVSVETLEGAYEVDIAHGTQTGKLLKIRGKGLPSLHGKNRGDLIAHVVVDTPTDLTKVQAELLRQLAGERSESINTPESSFVDKLKGAFAK